jgi:hypothetical protein
MQQILSEFNVDIKVTTKVALRLIVELGVIGNPKRCMRFKLCHAYSKIGRKLPSTHSVSNISGIVEDPAMSFGDIWYKWLGIKLQKNVNFLQPFFKNGG